MTDSEVGQLMAFSLRHNIGVRHPLGSGLPFVQLRRLFLDFVLGIWLIIDTLEPDGF